MATITDEVREKLVALYVMMFKAAPGSKTLAELKAQVDDGQSFVDIAVTLSHSPLFNDQFSELETVRQKIDLVLSTVRIDEDSDVYDFGFSYFQDGLNAGNSPGALLEAAANFLNTTEDVTGNVKLTH